MAGLISHGDGGPVTRCALCSRPAAGPCASCRRSVCGDCCVLTDGGATTFAVCLACARGGASLRRPWLGLVGWLLVIVLGLIAVGGALIAIRRL